MLGGRSHALVRLHNRGIVLQAILQHGRLSRRDLCGLSSLSPAPVTNIVRELIDSSLLYEIGTRDSATLGKVGRRQVLLELNPMGAYVVAVHLGVQRQVVALADLRANVFARWSQSLASGTSRQAAAQEACEAARRLVQERGPVGSRCVGIGVGVVGAVDPDSGVSEPDPQLGGESIPIGHMFEQALGLPTFVENNVRAMALGETWFGHGRNIDNLLLVYVSSVVGCGIVTDRRLYRGNHYGAGKLGHVIVEESGPRCSCGNRGCLEAIAALPAISAAGREASVQHGETLLHQLAPAGVDFISYSTVFEAAALGDRTAIRIVDRVADRLALAIWNLSRVLDPDLVVLALSSFADRDRGLIMSKIEEIITTGFLGNAAERPVIVETAIGDDIGLVGAATLALERFFRAPCLVPETALKQPSAALVP